MARSRLSFLSFIFSLAGLFLICILPFVGIYAWNGNDLSDIFGTITLIFAPCLGGLLGIVAVILGILGLREVKDKKLAGKGMAISGIILGAAPLVLTFIAACVAFLFAGAIGGSIGNVFSNIIQTLGTPVP